MYAVWCSSDILLDDDWLKLVVGPPLCPSQHHTHDQHAPAFLPLSGA